MPQSVLISTRQPDSSSDLSTCPRCWRRPSSAQFRKPTETVGETRMPFAAISSMSGWSSS
jgi:hypothetical protein